jgi:hypothetical protein
MIFALIFFTGSLLVKTSGTMKRAINFEWRPHFQLSLFSAFRTENLTIFDVGNELTYEAASI